MATKNCKTVYLNLYDFRKQYTFSTPHKRNDD